VSVLVRTGVRTLLLLLLAFGGGLTWASTIVRYEPAEAA
jgi:3-oxoacyl-[acyl-carrier-protein] synthase III